MRKLYVRLGAMFVVASGVATALAAPSVAAGRDSSGTGICEKATFMAPGGYYSSGNFYSDSGATATIHAAWCYSAGTVTSHHVSFQTSVSPSQGHLKQTVSTSPNGSSLTIEVSGSFATGIINNTGAIDLVGSLDGSGATNFENESAGG